jgi:hypothetical protein
LKAYLEAKVMMVMLLSRFRFKMDPKYNVEGESSPTIKAIGGMHVFVETVAETQG